MQNAGRREAALVVSQVEDAKGANGYDAASDTFVDMIKSGIVDPAKVTRLALQNSSSIAGLLLTTEAMITDVPEPEKPAPMPHDGGMGGMM